MMFVPMAIESAYDDVGSGFAVICRLGFSVRSRGTVARRAIARRDRSARSLGASVTGEFLARLTCA
jgi:hypothetical protein